MEQTPYSAPASEIIKAEVSESIEPNFAFCWALSWRLLMLSALIGFMPVAMMALTIGVLGRAIPTPFNYLALITAIFIAIIAAVAFALKILLSKNFRNASIRFYAESA